MITSPILMAVAAACGVAASVWLRSGSRLLRAARRIEAGLAGTGVEDGSARLARAAVTKELHTALLYGLLAVLFAVLALDDHPALRYLALVVLVPVGLTVVSGRRFFAQSALVEQRALLERRAEEALEQEAAAPRAWAARLAPHQLPPIEGFEVGHVYEPGTGLMAGDFYDLFRLGRSRLAAVIGDVSGHGIEPSITAFQVKYLLRVFLRQFRDPAQALEELNDVMSAHGRQDELVSLCIVVFDTSAGTMRWASAGHPPAWLWHDGEVRALPATGPLLTLVPAIDYTSREVALEAGDLVLLYTDGLTEARTGEQLFGEERVANHVRRDPGQDAEVLCKELLEAARDFAAAPLSDDVAILAIRRT